MDKFKISSGLFQAILFDFDGVLAESMNVKTEAFAKLFEPYGEETVDKVVVHHIKNGGISRYKKIEYYFSEYLGKPLSEDDVNTVAKKFSELVVEKVVKAAWVKGAKEFLEKHYQTIDLYVVTGTPQEEIMWIIDRRKMNKYFTGIYGTPDTKPVLFRRIMAEKGYDYDKVLYIGDCLSDYHDAVEANIPFLGRVPSGMDSVFPNNIQFISDFLDIE